jgi:hypothetical protein
MPEQDYSILDQPEILSFIFYPRKDFTSWALTYLWLTIEAMAQAKEHLPSAI